MEVKRRAFLQLLAAAPIAALAKWQPPTPAMIGFDMGVGEASMWFIAWSEHSVAGVYPAGGAGVHA